ncbi:MAG: formate dehydrogenase accessory sulfurtransferase FdhD [Planctomycetota bacterium]|jgi:FdhD protein
MDKSKQKPQAVAIVRAERISTGEAAPPQGEEVTVVQEAPVTIDVEGVETYTILCTPIDKLALAVGFLYTEGVIDSLDEVKVLKECDDDPNTIRVRLAGEVPRIDDAGRNLMIASSCGLCGSENIKQRIDALPQVGETMKIKAGLLRAVYGALRERQPLFEVCGGTHVAALFDQHGKIISSAEDTGRHSALDKAIGKCLLEGVSTAGCGAALTSRLSLEMVSKCARAGIELISAISAPTSLALEIAERCGITLCAFVRENRATVFTHPQRIEGLS